MLRYELRREIGIWGAAVERRVRVVGNLNNNLLDPTDTGHDEARAYPVGFCGEQARPTLMSGRVAYVCSADPDATLWNRDVDSMFRLAPVKSP